MNEEAIIPLKYNGFCSRCQERFGPFLYTVIDNIDPSESGKYEFFGTIVKPNFVMINNTRFNTRKAQKIRAKINQELGDRLMRTKQLRISLDTENYSWSHTNQPAECLVLEFEFHNDSNGNSIEPVKFVFGNDTILSTSPGEKFIVDIHRVKVNGIDYGYIVSTTNDGVDGPQELTDEMLEQIIKENSREKTLRGNRLL